MAQEIAGNDVERMKALLFQLARGIPESEAARIAGYTSQNGTHAIRAANGSQVGRAALAAEVERYLETEAAPLAIKTLVDTLKSKVKPAIKVNAAKILAGLAGYGPTSKRAGAGQAKQLTDMSPDELRAFISKHEREIERIEGELADRSTPVNAPTEAPETAKATSFLD